MAVNENLLTDAQMQRITRALSDPQRFAILERIAAEPEVACKQLVAEFPITQATISHHLKELVAAELIDSRRVGQCAMLARREMVLNEYVTQLHQRLLPPVANLSHGNSSPGNQWVPPECE
jgi:ArsR family transcriptional regulator, arsenate/arsenite/antimonite-responsive transcriptional repressor